MKIFPAIDIKDKKCVRLIKGDFENKTEYEMSPVEQAGKYKDHGFENLHSVLNIPKKVYLFGFCKVWRFRHGPREAAWSIAALG